MDKSFDDIIDAPLEDIDLFVNQSREEFDEAELRRLADNIKQNGLLQPGVCWLDPGRSRLVMVCGERRYRALKLAGMATMAVRVIRGPLSPGQMLQINLAENIQRASLNPIERGKAFRRLMQLEDLNATEVAARMNVTISMVSRDLSLLDLPEILQTRIAEGELPASVGSHIARIEDDETRRAFAERYQSGELTRDGVAREVRKLSRPKGGAKPQRLAVKLSGLSVSVAGKQADHRHAAGRVRPHLQGSQVAQGRRQHRCPRPGQALGRRDPLPRPAGPRPPTPRLRADTARRACSTAQQRKDSPMRRSHAPGFVAHACRLAPGRLPPDRPRRPGPGRLAAAARRLGDPRVRPAVAPLPPAQGLL